MQKNILDKLDIDPENIDEIQNVPIDELQAAATEALSETGNELQIPDALGGGYSMEWQPVIDGDFLPANPANGDSFG